SPRRSRGNQTHLSFVLLSSLAILPSLGCPSARTSRRSTLVNPNAPSFVAEYAEQFGNATRLEMERIFTTSPWLRLSSGNTAWAVKNMEVRFISRLCFQSSRVVLAMGL